MMMITLDAAAVSAVGFMLGVLLGEVLRGRK